jgi:hypothetical protein
MSDTGRLTNEQLRCLKQLPEDHEIVRENPGPIVRGPRGQWLRVTRSGRLAPTVESVKSYLNVNA